MRRDEESRGERGESRREELRRGGEKARGGSDLTDRRSDRHAPTSVRADVDARFWIRARHCSMGGVFGVDGADQTSVGRGTLVRNDRCSQEDA